MAPLRKKMEQFKDGKIPATDPRISYVPIDESEYQDFEIHELVVGFHNEDWHLGVISQTKNMANGKYSVSFPSSRETLQKGVVYKAGEKVEASKKRELCGASWYPATVEKVIADHTYYLIKYENNTTEILEPKRLRPVRHINPEKADKFELNSHVEVFVRGAWSNGVVEGVLPEGKYKVAFTESCLSQAKKKRGRPAKNSEQVSHPLETKRKKLAVRKKLTVSSNTRTFGSMSLIEFYSPLPNHETQEGSKRSSSEEAIVDADISNNKPSDLENVENLGFLLPCSTNSNLNPNELNKSLQYKHWDLDHILKTLSDILPQNPHIASLQGICKEEQETYKLYRMITYAKLEVSIQCASPDDELATFEGRLGTLNSLEKDGFYVDPLRTRLKSQVEIKKEISALVAEQAKAEEVYESVIKEVDELNAKLGKKLDEKVEAESRVSDLKSRVSQLKTRF